MAGSGIPVSLAVSWLVSRAAMAVAYLDKVKLQFDLSELLLVHGERDEVIPATHSQALATVAPQAQLLLLPEAGHNDIQEFAAYRDTVMAALRRR